MEEKRARLSNLLHRYRFEDLWPVTVTEVTDLLGDSTALGAEAAAEAAKLAQQEERGTPSAPITPPVSPASACCNHLVGLATWLAHACLLWLPRSACFAYVVVLVC